jgi:two-component system, cell cycle response regulator
LDSGFGDIEEQILKILIADDDLTSRTILNGALKKWGYDPIVVIDGKAAWEIMQEPDAPKLVILDWNMPELDGIEVCRRIRANATSDPQYVILLTSRGEKGSVVEGLDAGANDYITKPYDNAELRARIRVGEKMVELQSELIKARDALEHEAMHDALTGILNRRAILDMLEKELSRAQRQGTGISVGLCDLDHFKLVNDKYGHQVGDETLCGFVRTIQGNLRSYDAIGRYGGEEFLIIATDLRGSAQGENLYERLCACVAANPIPTSAGNIPITVSIGAVRWPFCSTVDDMIAAADSALYQAKKEGRNRAVYAGVPECCAVDSD